MHVWGRRPETEAKLCDQLRANGLDARPGYRTGAACVVTDDHEQCLDHGDFGNAVRAGVVDAQADRPVAVAIDERVPGRRSVADLTGIGSTDASVAGAVWGILG
ncbi:hypothetical protein ACFFS4_01590 [Kutzneria kofuensis]|uniref:Ornithine cyclodeaminase/alanine dehydrogenase-like protein (Mu-crystallin family) n=2 Tax=Kutzneria kofuensis TaxID=103725 RepID=A0A7W9NE80_9PSEU|nr:hypothetical protein [Kutzneria kofuensis]MBB5890032.1 ornithine cyclodeaminase/alanine dehydrogenase-like protein (mu-crystallin family) [Kutzneria kofuensis]